MAFHDQHMFDVRCEWGSEGLRSLARSDVIVIVDVLSFTTAVDVAVARGASVLPLPMEHDSAADYAKEQNAQLAGRRGDVGSDLTLSPQSLARIEPGTRLVLPSPNGSRLSFEASTTGSRVIAGSLRNARAVAEWCVSHGNAVAVIPAGERWEGGSMRAALEDSLGAGAIISYLQGSLSPEANAAAAAFRSVEYQLAEILSNCASGVELIERGFGGDVDLAAELNVSTAIPLLDVNAFADTVPRGST